MVLVPLHNNMKLKLILNNPTFHSSSQNYPNIGYFRVIPTFGELLKKSKWCFGHLNNFFFQLWYV